MAAVCGKGFSAELDTVQGCVGFLEQTVKQKDEEVRVWKSRCQRAEEDSIKQEQALIHGYKAEIATLKQQISQLRSGHSPVKGTTVVCEGSPRKKVQADEENEKFYRNLSTQLTELQAEMDMNSAATQKLEQALETTRLMSEDRAQQLAKEQKDHEATCAQLAALQQDNIELQQLKVKVTQLENSFEDREQNLATKVEENLKAEGLVRELEARLKATENYPVRIGQLKEVVTSLKAQLSTQGAQLSAKETELETFSEKVEELETVNSGLRDMVNQATADIQAKEHLMAELSAKVKECGSLEQTSLSPTSPLSSLQRKMRTLIGESDTANTKLTRTTKDAEKLRKDIAKATANIKEKDEHLKQLKGQMKQFEHRLDEAQSNRSDLEIKVIQLEKCVAHRDTEVEHLRQELSGKSSLAEELTEKLQRTDVELQAKKGELETMKEKLQSKTEELEGISGTLKGAMEKLKGDREELRQAVKQRDAEIHKLKGEFGTVKEEKEVEIGRLKSEVASIRSSADSGVEAKCGQIDRLQAELTSTQQQMDTIRGKLEKDVADRDCAIKNLNDLYEQHQKELDENDFTVRTLKKDLAKACNERKHEHENAVKASEQKQAQLEHDLDSKSKQLGELEEEVKSKECTITDLTSEFGELEKKNENLEESLLGKDGELDELRRLVKEIQDKAVTCSDGVTSELLQVKGELAEVKSSLHMKQTLHQRAKKELLDMTKVVKEMEDRSNAQDEARKTKVSALEQELAATKEQLGDVASLKQEVEARGRTAEDLRGELETTEAKVTELRSENLEITARVNEMEAKITEAEQRALKSHMESIEFLEEKCRECERLIKERDEKITGCAQLDLQLQQEKEKLAALVKACEEKKAVIDTQTAMILELEGQVRDLDGVKGHADKIKAEEQDKTKRIHQLTKMVEQLEVQLSASKAGSPDGVKLKEDVEEIRMELDRERVKSAEYHKLLEEIRLKDCLSPGSEGNSVRKLRKEKIEVDNALLEAKWKMSSLERRLADYDKSKASKIDVQNTEMSWRSKVTGDGSQVETLKAELRECHRKITSLEGLQDKVFSSPQRASVASPTVQRAELQRSAVSSPTVHRELNKSQEREQMLRRQLQQASTSLQELGDKVSDLEDQLSHKVKAIEDAEDTIRALKNPAVRSSRPSTVAEVVRLEVELKQRWGQVQDLQADLIRRDEKLGRKSQALRDFKALMEKERDDFTAALKDAKANEALIEMLKNAIAEQEETMEKQDAYLQSKEEEMGNLNQELEKYTDKYRQMLETSGDSGQKILELARENTRLVADQAPKIQIYEEAAHKLTEEKERLNLALRENNTELKDLERLLSESRTESQNLKVRLEERTNDSVAVVKEEHKAALQQLQIKIREKEHSLRDAQKCIRRLEDQVQTVKQQVSGGEKELAQAKRGVQDKESQLKTWRTERDNLVSGLEGIMKKQQKEIHDLREQVKTGHRVHHLDDSALSPEKSSHRSRHHDDSVLSPGRSVHRGHHHDIADPSPVAVKEEAPSGEDRLRSPEDCSSRRHTQMRCSTTATSADRQTTEVSSHRLSTTESHRNSSRRCRKRRSVSEPGIQLPAKKRDEQNCDTTFASEDSSVSEHVQIDATPPVAARNLRKSRRKTATADKESVETAGSSTRRTRKTCKAKKLLDDITESPIPDRTSNLPSTPDGSATYIDVEDHGTQMSGGPETDQPHTKRSRKRHQLYKENIQISEPLDCGVFVPSTPTDDVHGIVLRKLRTRKH